MDPRTINLVVILQFYEADKRQAMRLARLIADLEVFPRNDVEFVFSARFDCGHDLDTIKHVAQKFPVEIFTTYTKWTGWPAGPNGCAKDVLEKIWSETQRNTRWEDARGFLLIEPDCLPVQSDWLDQLIKAWEARTPEALIMGAWRNSGPPGGHLNGNCILAPEACAPKYTEAIGPGYAWDCEISARLSGSWQRTGLIKNCFKMANATREQLTTPDEGMQAPCLIHGFKDDASFELAVELLKT